MKKQSSVRKKADTVRFIFHGNAMPFGGRVISRSGKPAPALVPSAPTGALSVSGGVSRADSKGSTWQDVFSWGPTIAEASGEILDNGHSVTTVTSSIAGVSAINAPIKFAADLLRVTLVSDHPDRGQPSIVPREIVFGSDNGMFLDGKPIRVEYDNDLSTFDTFSAFEREYQKNNEFYRKYQACIARPPAKPKGLFGERLPRVAGGYVSTSIVRRIYFDGKRVNGNVLALTGFGRIYFGELLMNENNRRLTLVRLVMGSDVGAEMSCAEVDPNGTWAN